MKYNPNHRWYYLSNQTPDEVTLIKCYDSEVDRARLTPHSAFLDASSPGSEWVNMRERKGEHGTHYDANKSAWPQRSGRSRRRGGEGPLTPQHRTHRFLTLSGSIFRSRMCW